MLIKEKFQGEQMKEASEEIQVENGIDFHLPFCLNLSGFNVRILQNLAETWQIMKKPLIIKVV
jgi:hypothetical protein